MTGPVRSRWRDREPSSNRLDTGAVLDLARAGLLPGGSLVVIEWARERFDEPTARWCFDHLPPAGEPSWLQQRYDEWGASRLPCEAYCRAWAQEERLHGGEDIIRELDARFNRQWVSYGPYFFPDLAGISGDDEQAAIDEGKIQANRISYVSRRD